MFGKGKKNVIAGSYQVTANGKKLTEQKFSRDPELLLLSALLTMQQATPQELAINVHMSQSDVKRALSSLRAKGFVVPAGAE